MSFFERLISRIFYRRPLPSQDEQPADIEAAHVFTTSPHPHPMLIPQGINIQPHLLLPSVAPPSVAPHLLYPSERNIIQQTRGEVERLRLEILQLRSQNHSSANRARMNDEQIRAQNECEPGFTKRDRKVILSIFTILLTINQAVSSAAGSSRIKIDSCIWQTATLSFVGMFFLIFPWLSKEKNRKYFDSPIPKIGILCTVIAFLSFCINFFPLLANKITRFSTIQNPADACEKATTEYIGTYSEAIYILCWIACTLVMITPLFFSPLMTELINYFQEKINYQHSSDLNLAGQKVALLEQQIKNLEEQCIIRVTTAEMKHEIADLKKELEHYKRIHEPMAQATRKIVAFSSPTVRDSARSAADSLPTSAARMTPRVL